jgi:hypothetical protein
LVPVEKKRIKIQIDFITKRVMPWHDHTNTIKGKCKDIPVRDMPWNDHTNTIQG